MPAAGRPSEDRGLRSITGPDGTPRSRLLNDGVLSGEPLSDGLLLDIGERSLIEELRDLRAIHHAVAVRWDAVAG